jgi:hypothetical protein
MQIDTPQRKLDRKCARVIEFLRLTFDGRIRNKPSIAATPEVAFIEARSYFDQGVYVCMEEPDDTPGSDPSIVTNCWLYSTDAVRNETAREAALSERALLMAVCFPPEDA